MSAATKPPVAKPPVAKPPGTKKNGTEPAGDSKNPAGHSDAGMASDVEKTRKADSPASSKTDVASANGKSGPDDGRDGGKPKSGAHKVARGDTLRKIAKARLGDENRWREIYVLNKQQLATPDGLEIGTTLAIPTGDKPEKSAKRVASKPSRR